MDHQEELGGKLLNAKGTEIPDQIILKEIIRDREIACSLKVTLSALIRRKRMNYALLI